MRQCFCLLKFNWVYIVKITNLPANPPLLLVIEQSVGERARERGREEKRKGGREEGRPTHCSSCSGQRYLENRRN